MTQLTMTPERQARLAALLPAGYALDQIRMIEVEGVVTDDELSPIDKAVIATVTAAPSPINAHGKPTVMRVVAWLCHADTVNLNGDAFVAQELAAIAPTLFRAPDFGVMDWNHSAVLNWNDDPAMIGVWYGAEYAWDAQALNGAGAFGIRATGMMFSWLFPEQANEMLADQVRDGHVRFSMACIAGSVEFGAVNGQSASILHNPVFFTNSALNRQNADVDANGAVSEDPTVTSDLLRNQLAGNASLVQATDGLGNTLFYQVSGTLSGGTTTTTWPSGITTTQWDGVIATPSPFNPKGIRYEIRTKDGTTTLVPIPASDAQAHDVEDALMKTKIAELEARVLELESIETALKASEVVLQEQITTLTDERNVAVAALEEGTLQHTATLDATAALTTRVDELTTSVDALTVALAASEDALAIANEALAVAAAAQADSDAKDAELALAAKLVARMDELPQLYLDAHAKRDAEKQVRIEAAWLALSDEEWELKKEELVGGFPAKVGFVSRSQVLGVLPVSDASDGPLKAQIKSLIKSK